MLSLYNRYAGVYYCTTTAVGDVTANVPKDNNMLVDKHDDDDTASSCHHNPLNTTNNDSAMMTSTARPLIFEYTRLNNNTNGHEHDDAVRTSKVSDGNCSSAEEQHIILNYFRKMVTTLTALTVATSVTSTATVISW